MSKKKGGGGDVSGWQKEDDEIQAIVIADSFNRRFSPITHQTPRALLPLGNKSILDYTIEYLVEESVQDIVIFCCSFGEKIREYVNKKWSSNPNFSSKCSIHCVMSSTSDCLCLGDALREIDREGLIRSDFILVYGDVISNVKLGDVIREHKEARKKEKNLAMTMLHRRIMPGNYRRHNEEDVFMVLEKETNRILHHQKSHACQKLVLPTTLISNRKEINIHHDSADCHIYICSPQVAPLFTDNFDYQTLDDFVRGILVNEEILGDQIRSYTVANGYSIRINDLHMYNMATLDLMNRWIYPLIPDSSFYIYRRNNVYVEKEVSFERDCMIKDGVMIAKGTVVGEHSKLSKSVIGSNCKIGRNVEIENSYIWDNCTIGDNVTITQSVICSDATIMKGVSLIDSIISYGVCVGEDMKIEPMTRLSLLRKEDIEDEFENLSMEEEKKEHKYDVLIVGNDGKGYVWPFDSEEEEFIPSLTGNNYESFSDESSDEDDDESVSSEPHTEYTNLEQFYMEVVENLRSGIAENIATDNIALEINASKFKYNIIIPELCETVIKAILELSVKDDSRAKQDIVKDMNGVIEALSSLLTKYFNKSEEQIYVVTAAEEYFSHHLELVGIFATYLHKMYDDDIIDENLILEWYNSPPKCEDVQMKEVFKQMRENQTLKKLVTWLEEAEEESDEESD